MYFIYLLLKFKLGNYKLLFSRCFSVSFVQQIQPDGYAMFGSFLNATNRPMVFSCSYPAYQHWIDGVNLNWSQLAENCNLWRMLDDIQVNWAPIRQNRVL